MQLANVPIGAAIEFQNILCGGKKNLNTKRKAVVSASQSAEAVLTGRFYMSVQFSSLLLFG
jgi:hypothetical protein